MGRPKDDKRNSVAGAGDSASRSQQELAQLQPSHPQAAKQSAPGSQSPVLAVVGPDSSPHRLQDYQQQRKSFTAAGLSPAPAPNTNGPASMHLQLQQPPKPEPVTVLRFALTARPLEELGALAPILSRIFRPPDIPSAIHVRQL